MPFTKEADFEEALIKVLSNKGFFYCKHSNPLILVLSTA